MQAVTPDQSKFVLDNLGIARKVASRYTKASLHVDFDDFTSVCTLAICELAASGRWLAMDERAVYMHCVGKLGNYMKSRANFKIKDFGQRILSLDEIHEDRGEEFTDGVMLASVSMLGWGGGGLEEFLKKHCRRGHELSPGNTYGTNDNKCKKCNQDGQRKRNERYRKEKELAKTQN